MDEIDVLKHKHFQQVLSCCLLLIVITSIPFKNNHGDGTEDYQILHTSYQNIRIFDSSMVLLLDCGLDGRGFQDRYQARIRDYSLLHSAQTSTATHPASSSVGTMVYFDG
jgi:hypothetical protein